MELQESNQMVGKVLGKKEGVDGSGNNKGWLRKRRTIQIWDWWAIEGNLE